MSRISFLAACLFCVAACGALPFFNSKSTSSSTESARQTESVKVNGQEIGSSDGDDAETRAEAKTADIGKTCHKNNECQAEACYVGAGDLGYCTKMCNSWSDCPTHWECKKPGNAPQKICMQDD